MHTHSWETVSEVVKKWGLNDMIVRVVECTDKNRIGEYVFTHQKFCTALSQKLSVDGRNFEVNGSDVTICSGVYNKDTLVKLSERMK